MQHKGVWTVGKIFTDLLFIYKRQNKIKYVFNRISQITDSHFGTWKLAKKKTKLKVKKNYHAKTKTVLSLKTSQTVHRLVK